MKRQVERDPTKYIPPRWCADICVNSGRPGCVYDCAEERQGRFFVPDPDLTLEDIAPFPIHDWQINSSPKERQAIAGLYLSKLVEAVTGVPQDAELDLLRKELEAASNEKLMEIVGKVLNGSMVYEAEKEGAPS